MSERPEGNGPRTDIDEMTSEACWGHLDDAASGRVALERHGRPVVYPVNHVTDGRTIVFRTGANSVLGLMASHQPVTFEVDDGEPTTETGWSVAVIGEIERIERQDRAQIDPQPLPWAPGRVDAWIRIRPISVTGRELTRPARQGVGSRRRTTPERPDARRVGAAPR